MKELYWAFRASFYLPPLYVGADMQPVETISFITPEKCYYIEAMNLCVELIRESMDEFPDHLDYSWQLYSSSVPLTE